MLMVRNESLMLEYLLMHHAIRNIAYSEYCSMHACSDCADMRAKLA
jgi:hypothetical protein